MKSKNLKYKVALAENLEYMATLKDETFRFIYIDPPFNTNKTQRGKRYTNKDWDRKLIDLEYYDSYGDGIQGYLEFMRPRLRHCHRLLDKKGILCVHLDYNSSHYIKCMLDDIFGFGNIDTGSGHFVNEVIWHYQAGKGGKKSYKKNMTQF